MRLTSTLPNSTPASRSFSMNTLLASIAYHRRIERAITGPTPSVMASAASSAARIESSVPKAQAQRLAGRRPEALDAERGQQLRQRPCLRPLDPREQLVGADLGETLESQQLLGGQRVDVGRIGDEPGVAELEDRALAEALDVHRAREAK